QYAADDHVVVLAADVAADDGNGPLPLHEPDGTIPPPVKFIGSSIKRLEDPRLLAGGGRYVDDLARPGMAHAVVVRSPHAHPPPARVGQAGARRALAHPPGRPCLPAPDLPGVPMIPLRQPGKPRHAAYLQPPLASDRVRYSGQPVAVVVASDRLAAVEAREL